MADEDQTQETEQIDHSEDQTPAPEQSLDELATAWQNAAGEVANRRNPSVDFLFGENVSLIERGGYRLALIDRGDQLDRAIAAEEKAWERLVSAARSEGYEVVSQETSENEGDSLVLLQLVSWI